MDAEQSQSALDDAFLVEVIRERYHAQALALQQLPSGTGKYIYQVDLATGARWILRVVEDASKDTLVELGRLLMFFEQNNYAAERIIVTSEQEALSSAGNWHFCMTTFLAGTPLDASPAALRLLGASLGQLHALKPLLTSTPPQAGMLPAGELAFAQRQLIAIAPLVPGQYRQQYEYLETALSSIVHGTDLPTTLIHNDCHPWNALLTAPDKVTLFDWEGAGMGPAVLDIGFLLANCDRKAPWEPLARAPFHPDEERLRSVVEGYAQYHQLSTRELDYLPHAIRFRSLVFGACNFAEAIARHEPAEFSRWWWTRYSIADEIAATARRYFEQ